MTRTTPQSQRGGAALIVTLMLFLAMALAAFAVNRHLVFEQRGAANQARAAQAFEAAEAGLEWAQAQLNSTQRVGPDCKPSADPAAASFRERTLSLDRSTGAINAIAPRTGCVHSASGWSCSCPTGGPTTLSMPTSNVPTLAFSLQFRPGARAGTVRVSASGCTSLAGECLPGSTTTADATARTEVTLALFSGMRTPPAAALTTRDAASQTTDQFFAAAFGVDKKTWKTQPVVARLACGTDCNHAIGEAIAAGSTLIWIEGDLTLAGPVTLGSPARPVVIVAGGAARLDGAVMVIGAIYAASVALSDTSTIVQGAVINEGAYTGPALPDFRHDADVLAALNQRTGSFARVSGSWRDF
jgi:Tfp pilus assembly protein PilX